jgi:hypothetical protein
MFGKTSKVADCTREHCAINARERAQIQRSRIEKRDDRDVEHREVEAGRPSDADDCEFQRWCNIGKRLGGHLTTETSCHLQLAQVSGVRLEDDPTTLGALYGVNGGNKQSAALIRRDVTDDEHVGSRRPSSRRQREVTESFDDTHGGIWCTDSFDVRER